MNFLRIFLIFCTLSLCGGAWAYNIGGDKEFDLNAVETITAHAALDLLGSSEFSGNKRLRYWNKRQVERFVGFKTNLRCIVGDCSVRYNIDEITSYGTYRFITSYSWREKTDSLVGILQMVLDEARKRKLGVIFEEGSLSDEDSIFFVM